MEKTQEAIKYAGKVVEALVASEARKAIKYVDEKTVVTATRKVFGGKIDKRGNIEVVLKIGKPNYAEREFIKKLKKVKEPFPVKKIVLNLFKNQK